MGAFCFLRINIKSGEWNIFSIKKILTLNTNKIKIKNSQMSLKYTSQSIFISLIIAFIFHNIEEAVSICSYPVQSPFEFIKPATCRQFMIAVSIITVVVLFAFGIAIRTKKPAVYLLISTAIASGLVLNVLIPHLFVAIYTLNYTPGLITAITLNLPLGLIVLSKNKSDCESRKQFIQYVGIGLVIGYLLFAAIMRLVMLFIQ